MSILETFYILFKSDASEVKKGADEAEKSTKHLQDSLKGVNDTSDKLGKSFLNMATSFSKLVGTIVSVTSIVAGVRSATEYTAELGKVSRALNVNVSDLDAWGNAVQRSGGTATGFENSLRSLSKRFGITGDQALKLMGSFSDSLSKLSQVQALNYGKNVLGLDEATILLLQKGRREVDEVIKRQKELGVVNQRDAEQVKKFQEAVYDAGVATRSFFRELFSPAIPYFTKFINYFIEHKDLVVGGLIAIGAAAAVLAAPFIAANAVVIVIAAGITALIALFALIYDDIQAFMKGNNSLIGTLLERWPIVGKVFSAVFEQMKSAIYALMHPLETLQNALNKVWGRIRGIFGHNKELTVNINQGQGQMAAAGGSSIQSFNTNTLRSVGGRNNTVNTGPITINTNATDAQGVAGSFTGEVNKQIAQVNSHVDDGVAY